jgi:hypothetical protein
MNLPEINQATETNRSHNMATTQPTTSLTHRSTKINQQKSQRNQQTNPNLEMD